MDISITRNDLLVSSPTSSPNLIDDFLRPMAYTAVQAPIKGLAQIAIGTKDAEDIHVVAPPPKADSWTLRWHLQQTGAMVGMLAPILLLHKNVSSKLSNGILGEIESTAASKALTQRAMIDSALTGALYEGFLQPVNKDQQGNLVESKFKNAFIGAITFGALTRLGSEFKAGYNGQTGGFARFAASDLGSSMLAGVPTGIANAELNAILHKHELASFKDTWESVYSFSVLGAALSGGKKLFGGSQADNALVNRQADNALTNRQAVPERTAALDKQVAPEYREPLKVAPIEYKSQRMFPDYKIAEPWESALPNMSEDGTKAHFDHIVESADYLYLATDNSGRFGLYNPKHSLLLILPDSWKTAAYNGVIVDSKIDATGLQVTARIPPAESRPAPQVPDNVEPPRKRMVMKMKL